MGLTRKLTSLVILLVLASPLTELSAQQRSYWTPAQTGWLYVVDAGRDPSDSR